MSMDVLSLMDDGDISASFMKRFFELQKFEKQLVNRHESTTAIQRLVQPLVGHITKREISKCDPAALSLFLEGAVQIARLVIQADAYEWNDSERQELSPEVMDCCVWLCSLSVAGSVASDISLEIAGTWIYANLVKHSEMSLDVPHSYLADLVTALAPLRLVESDISGRARVEFVLHVSKLLSSGKSISEQALYRAKGWCGELVALPPVVGGLREAARILDVTIPEEKKDDLRDDELTRAAAEFEIESKVVEIV